MSSPMDMSRIDRIHRHHRQSVMSLPNYIKHTAGLAGFPWLHNSIGTLDTLSVHSDDVTSSRDAHVSRVSGRGVFRKFSRALQERFLMKRNSLDCVTESLAINHTDPANLINRCASCNKLMSSKDILSRRISLTTPKHLEQIDCDQFDNSPRNFSSHLSPVSLNFGRVHTDMSLASVSQLPLLIDIKNNHIFIYVDGSRRYCKYCNKRRISIPYLIGVVDLPMYMNSSTMTLTFVQETDTLIIVGATSCLKAITPQHATEQTKPKLIKVRSL